MIPFLVLDEIITLQCGLKAVKTIYGWTVMGPIPVHSHVVQSHSLALTTDQVNDLAIKNL